jgi:hypothetical protein
VIFFEESSNDKNVHVALQTARNLRRALREAEGVQKVAKQATVYDRSS